MKTVASLLLLAFLVAAAEAQSGPDAYEERELSAPVQHSDAPQKEDYQLFDEEAASAPSRLDHELGQAAAGLHGLPSALKEKLAFLGVNKFKQDVEPPVEFEAEKDVGPGSDSDLKQRIRTNDESRVKIAEELSDQKTFAAANQDKYRTARDLVLGDEDDDVTDDDPLTLASKDINEQESEESDMLKEINQQESKEEDMLGTPVTARGPPSPPIDKNVNAVKGGGHVHAMKGEATEAAAKAALKETTYAALAKKNQHSGAHQTSWQGVITMVVMVAAWATLQ
jgi:hypothetical protein